MGKHFGIKIIRYKVKNAIHSILLETILKKAKKGTKDMYLALNSNTETPSGKTKWNASYHFSDEIWKRIYIWPHTVTKNSTLKWFQYRINHNILATNEFLCKIKIINSPLCTLCKKYSETIKHIFWECEVTKRIIKEVQEWLVSKNITLEVEEQSFLFGIYQNSGSIFIQQILLETKYYLYYCRCSKMIPNMDVLKQRIKLLYETSKMTAVMENKYEQFVKLWEDFLV